MTFKQAMLSAALLGAAMGLSACGTGGGGGGAALTPPPPPEAPPPAPPPPPPPAPDSFETPEYFAADSSGAARSGLDLINASAAYGAGASGQGLTLAVIDTGLDADHPEFAGRIAAASTDAAGNRGFDDSDGHGTAVAGLAAAARDGQGMHGAAFEATILAVRADTPGSCQSEGGSACAFSDANTAAAIDLAVQGGADIINLSLGRQAALDDGDTLTFAALRRAADAGVVLVLPAGNTSAGATPRAAPGFPGNFASDPGADGLAVAVGSVDLNGLISSFTNRARGVETAFLTAPGEGLLAPSLDGGPDAPGYETVTGTSFAAPYVAGALALLMDAFPNLSGADALSILLDTAADLGAPGPDEIYGMGLVDLDAAFQPVGASSVQLGANARRVELHRALSAPSGPFGDWLWASGLLDEALLRDGYERAFAFTPSRPAIREAALSERALERAAGAARARSTLITAGPTRMALRTQQSAPHILSNLPEDVYAKPADVSIAFSHGGLDVEAGRGFTGPAPAASAGGAILSRAGFSGALAGLAEPDAFGAVRYALAGAAVQLRVSASEADTLQAGAVSYTLAGQTVGVEVGAGRESGHALGAPLATRLGGADGASSRFAAALWSGALPGGWRGAARLEHVTAQVRLPDWVALKEPVQASAWTLGADRALAGGVFGLTLSQALRVEAGAVSASAPVGVDADYDTVFERRTASLAPSGREVSLEAGWRTSWGQHTTASLAVRLANEPGHVRDAAPEGLIWLGLRTRR